MKKFNTLFILLSLVLMGTTSCKRNWQCVCSTGGIVNEVTIIHDLGRYGAKNVCDNYQTQNNLHGARQVCDLK